MCNKATSDIYLIGRQEEIIRGGKLPTIRQILSLFFHKYRTLKLTKQQSFHDTIQSVENLWNMAEIPTQRKDHMLEKLKNYHNEWIIIKKSSSRKKSLTQKQKEDNFIAKINGIFDVAHHDVFKLLSDERYQFLLSQRSPTHRGFIDFSKNFPYEINNKETPQNTTGKYQFFMSELIFAQNHHTMHIAQAHHGSLGRAIDS